MSGMRWSPERLRLAALVVALAVALAAPGCGKRRCDEGECQIVRDADGEIVETICPDDCDR